MIDPIEQAMDIVGYEEIVYALVEAGLIPTRGDWGVLENGRPRTFGCEKKAREFVANHAGSKLIHVYEYDWAIVE